MSQFWNYEIKETAAHGGDFHAPECPQSYPHETDAVIGICYRNELPGKEISPDDAYLEAIQAKYYLWHGIDNRWELINNEGNPDDFLHYLASRNDTKFRISWPEPFENHPHFNNVSKYKVLSWRELIRRNFDSRAFVSDRDLLIHKWWLGK